MAPLPSLPPLSRSFSPNILPVTGAGGGGDSSNPYPTGPIITNVPIQAGGGDSSGSTGGVFTPVSSSTGGNTPGQRWVGGMIEGLVGLFPWGRVAAFILGLILIGAGLLLMKQVQQAVKVTVKTAGKAAARAAAEGGE